MGSYETENWEFELRAEAHRRSGVTTELDYIG